MRTEYNYLIKTDSDDNRHVYRIEKDLGVRYEVTNPLFVCFGSVFSNWGRKRTVSKKWLETHGFRQMSTELSKKYDSIKKDESPSVLYK